LYKKISDIHLLIVYHTLSILKSHDKKMCSDKWANLWIACIDFEGEASSNCHHYHQLYNLIFLSLFSAVEFGYVQPNQSSQPMKINAD